MDTQKQTSFETCPTSQSDNKADRSPFRKMPSLPQKRSLGWVCLLALIAGIGAFAHLTGGQAVSVAAASANGNEENGIDGDLERRVEEFQTRSAALQRDEVVENRFRTLQQKMLPGGSLPVIARLRIAYEPAHQLKDPLDVAAQRALIERRQAEVLQSLEGYDSASVKSYQHLPLLALRVNAAGLASLAQSNAVIDIFEDTMAMAIASCNRDGTSSIDIERARKIASTAWSLMPDMRAAASLRKAAEAAGVKNSEICERLCVPAAIARDVRTNREKPKNPGRFSEALEDAEDGE